jgi:hypothetical protein
MVYNWGMSDLGYKPQLDPIPASLRKRLEEVDLHDALPLDDADLTNDQTAEKIHQLRINTQRVLFHVLSGLGYAESYRKVYPGTPEVNAYKNCASMVKNNREILQAILEKQGLSQYQLAKRLGKLVRSKEPEVALKALRIAYDRHDKVEDLKEDSKKNTQVIIVRDEKQGKFAIGIKG